MTPSDLEHAVRRTQGATPRGQQNFPCEVRIRSSLRNFVKLYAPRHVCDTRADGEASHAIDCARLHEPTSRRSTLRCCANYGQRSRCTTPHGSDELARRARAAASRRHLLGSRRARARGARRPRLQIPPARSGPVSPLRLASRFRAADHVSALWTRAGGRACH